MNLRLAERESKRQGMPGIAVGQAVQEHTKAVRHVAMIAEPVRAQFALQFFIAVLTFAAFAVLVVNALGQRASPWPIGYHGATVGALGTRFALHDDHHPRAGDRLTA